MRLRTPLRWPRLPALLRFVQVRKAGASLAEIAGRCVATVEPHCVRAPRTASPLRYNGKVHAPRRAPSWARIGHTPTAGRCPATSCAASHTLTERVRASRAAR